MKTDKYGIPELVPDKAMCCGCGTCAAICRQNAITLKSDDEGFIYPEINPDKCIGCRQCVNICSFRNNSDKRNTEPDVYAAYLCDNDKLQKSSSGGAFIAVSDVILEQGGLLPVLYLIIRHGN